MYGLNTGTRQAQYGAILAPSPTAEKQRSKRSRRRERARRSREDEVPAVTSTARCSQTPSQMLRARPDSQKDDCNALLMQMQRLVALLEEQQIKQTQQTTPNVDAPNHVYPTAAPPQNMSVAAGVSFSFLNHDMVGQQATNQPGSEISQLSQSTGWVPESSQQSPWNHSPVGDFSVENGNIAQSEADYMTALAYQPNINSVAGIQQPLGALGPVDDLQGSV